MALIKCPECGGTVSDKAPVCVHCGFPLQSHLEKTEKYSVVVASDSSSLQGIVKLCEIANISSPAAKEILSSPGSVIMSGLSKQNAQAISSQLASVGCSTSVVKDEAYGEQSDVQSGSFPSNLVLRINKYKAPRKERPCIESSWKQGFPDITHFCPGGNWRGIRYYWKNDESENAPFSRVSLFNFKKAKLEVCKVSEVQCVPNSGNLFIWLDQDVKKFTTVPAIAVLGDVYSVPTDELNLTGSISVRTDQFGNAIPVCPVCGSSSIQVVKQGFGAGKAAAGALLLGPIGLAAGAIGSGNIQRVCANCGHKF